MPADTNQDAAESGTARNPDRFFALIGGPAYLLFVARVFADVTKAPFVATLGLTVAGAAAIMTVLCLLGVKAYQYKDTWLRFSFSTVFLLAIPLCIYLAALRLLLQGTPLQRLSLFDWFAVPAASFFVMTLNTIILLWFADAIVWFAIALRRR